MPGIPKLRRRRKRSGEDFKEHVVGRRERRKRKARRALRIAARAVLAAAVLAAGFILTDALLRVSQQPLPEEPVTAAPAPTTTQPVTRPVPQGPPMHSFYVPLAMLDQNEDAPRLVAQAREMKANTAVMPFKDSAGYLSYRSNLMQMRLLHANQKARYRTDWTLYDLKKAGQRILAVIHCFDDPLAAAAMPEGAVLLRDSGNVPWKDAQGKRWLNPWSEPAREYLLAVMREVVAFGADDILLCGVRFPSGNLQGAVFPGQKEPGDPALRNVILRQFIEEAKEAVGEAAALYVMIPSQAALNGAEELGGDLWDSAADWIAVDVRGAPWPQDAEYWRTRPVIPVVEDPETARKANARDYIVLIDETSDVRR